MNVTVEDLKYLAGVIDARGSLFCQKVMQPFGKNYNYVPLLTFYSIDSRRIAPIAKAIGVDLGNQLQLGKENTLTLLRVVRPYLKYRKPMVDELLKLEDIRLNSARVNKQRASKTGISLTQSALARMEQHYQKFLKLKSYRDDGK